MATHNIKTKKPKYFIGFSFAQRGSKQLTHHKIQSITLVERQDRISLFATTYISSSQVFQVRKILLVIDYQNTVIQCSLTQLSRSLKNRHFPHSIQEAFPYDKSSHREHCLMVDSKAGKMVGIAMQAERGGGRGFQIWETLIQILTLLRKHAVGHRASHTFST